MKSHNASFKKISSLSGDPSNWKTRYWVQGGSLQHALNCKILYILLVESERASMLKTGMLTSIWQQGFTSNNEEIPMKTPGNEVAHPTTIEVSKTSLSDDDLVTNDACCRMRDLVIAILKVLVIGCYSNGWPRYRRYDCISNTGLHILKYEDPIELHGDFGESVQQVWNCPQLPFFWECWGDNSSWLWLNV